MRSKISPGIENKNFLLEIAYWALSFQTPLFQIITKSLYSLLTRDSWWLQFITEWAQLRFQTSTYPIDNSCIKSSNWQTFCACETQSHGDCLERSFFPAFVACLSNTLDPFAHCCGIKCCRALLRVPVMIFVSCVVSGISSINSFFFPLLFILMALFPGCF